MGSWKKLLRGMFASANPCNYTYEDCARVLRRLNFVEVPNSGTSHRRWVLERPNLPPVNIGLLKRGTGKIGKEYVKDMLRDIRANGLFDEEPDETDEEAE